MPIVVFARHLHRFFPVLAKGPLVVSGRTAAEIVQAVDQLVPGLANYIITERGELRLHVNMFVGEEMIVDRGSLSDQIPEDACVSIYQALSGG